MCKNQKFKKYLFSLAVVFFLRRGGLLILSDQTLGAKMSESNSSKLPQREIYINNYNQLLLIISADIRSDCCSKMYIAIN